MKKLQWIILLALFVVIALLQNVKQEDVVQYVAGEKVEQSDQVDITFLDVDQGDATFIEFPDGQQMLIDCAQDGRVLESLGRVMDFYDKTIDYLVVTHPDLDHYGGCQDVLERFDVGHVWYTSIDKSYDDQWKAWWYAVEDEGSQYKQIMTQELIDIAGARLHILYPDHDLSIDPRIPGEQKEPNGNNTSIVMRLDYGEHSVLLPGDAESEIEEYLLSAYTEDILDVDILKLGHHGSDSSSIQEFIEATSPDHVIASCGFENKFGHPSRRVLKRLERIDSTVWRTDVHGDIYLTLKRDKLNIDSSI